MAIGARGVDVEELQAGLQAFGISTGEDASGVYGKGTAAAVTRLYWHYGFDPVTQSVNANRQGRTASTQSYATVPLGEIAFVTTLPATVAKIAHLGQQLASGKAFAQLSSGQVSLTAKTDANTASLLRVGIVGYATSDISGKSIAVRITSVGSAKPSSDPTAGPEAAVAFSPLKAGQAAAFIGQNLAVHVTTGSRKREWVVPVTALVTNAAGRSSVTVLLRGKQKRIPVRAGALLQGAQVVYPEGASLYPSEPIVVGVTSR
jgi:hypothetical protein